MPAHSYGTSSGHLFLVESIPTFRRTEQTSPDKERILQMRNGQETHADKQIENFVLSQTSINAVQDNLKFVSSMNETITFLSDKKNTISFVSGMNNRVWHVSDMNNNVLKIIV